MIKLKGILFSSQHFNWSIMYRVYMENEIYLVQTCLMFQANRGRYLFFIAFLHFFFLFFVFCFTAKRNLVHVFTRNITELEATFRQVHCIPNCYGR